MPAWALYDPQPVADIALLQGEWLGTLTYNDYSRPGNLVTLPTRLFAALSAPSDLSLHYVYDDGPGKTVYSYERLSSQSDGRVIVLASTGAKPSETRYNMVSRTRREDLLQLQFERTREAKQDRFTLEVGPRTLSLKKEEIEGTNAPVFRNEYRLRRAGT